jgi:pimeloyl-ACP methyl ester carboxylesterase
MLILDKLNSFLRSRIQALGGQSRNHVIDGQHVHSYEIEGRGEGPPLVLVHGLGASGHSFFPVLNGLLSKWSRIYLPDLPGHGFSRQGEPLDIRGQQEIFRGFVDRIVREPAVLIGNSLGGAVVLQTAVDRPHMAGVGMLAPAGAPLMDDDIHRLRHTFAMDSRAKAIDFFNRLTHRQSPIGWLIASDLQKTFGVRAVQHILQEARTDEQFEQQLIQSLEMPVLLVWGSSERILPADGIHYFRKVLPSHARIEVFDECGHLPMIEKPRRTIELINDLAHAARHRSRQARAM